MKLLPIPDGVRSIVYTTIVKALRADVVLKTVIPADHWRTYLDDTGDPSAPVESTLPMIDILPHALHAAPESIATQASPMGIAITVAVEGLDIRDLLNLWDAVEASIFKGNGLSTLKRDLNAALAGKGGQAIDVRLLQPAITPDETEKGKQVLLASGTVVVNMTVKK